MENDFTITLPNQLNRGNDPLNKILDFEDNSYEVCVQDVILLANTWSNVRESGNWIKGYAYVFPDHDERHVFPYYFNVKPKAFKSNDDFTQEIANSLHVGNY